jgi:hypothetical protein
MGRNRPSCGSVDRLRPSPGPAAFSALGPRPHSELGLIPAVHSYRTATRADRRNKNGQHPSGGGEKPWPIPPSLTPLASGAVARAARLLCSFEHGDGGPPAALIPTAGDRVEDFHAARTSLCFSSPLVRLRFFLHHLRLSF